jgi:hypothetical protein
MTMLDQDFGFVAIRDGSRLEGVRRAPAVADP